MDNQDLKYIKKHYGENFAKLCRELFPTILEVPGELTRIITSKFDAHPTLFQDMSAIKDKFKRYVFSFFETEKRNKLHINKTAEQLLDEAGYILYPECKTEDDIQKFKKYYAKNEELCTFRGKRLYSCRVWFAVKKDVNKIKRENFPYPERQDEYGTSVISIQFTKDDKSVLSIKNRYNHAVDNPDATFGNDLEKIIPGLTDAFCEEYGIDLMTNELFALKEVDYVLAKDGKLYKSNCKSTYGNCECCANNIVVDRDRNVTYYDKSKYLLLDGYLFDLVNKTVVSLPEEEQDAFTKSIGNIKSINITLDENKNRLLDIVNDKDEKIQVVANKSNQIIKYSNENITEIGERFLDTCKHIKEVNLPKVETIEKGFCSETLDMKKISLPNVKKIGSYFLYYNIDLEEIESPKVEIIEDNFLRSNKALTKISLPNLKSVGYSFLGANTSLKQLDLPNLEEVGNGFLYYNNSLTEISLPKLDFIDKYFMYNNEILTKVDLPNVTEIGESFLESSTCLKELCLPKVETVGEFFMHCNTGLKKLVMPKVVEIKESFLVWNEKLEELYMPNIKKIEGYFLSQNNSLEKLDLPSVETIGAFSLTNNYSLKEIHLPNIKKIGMYFLKENKNIDVKKIEKNIKSKEMTL